MRRSSGLFGLALLAMMADACKREVELPDIRGAGRVVAKLSPREQANAYSAAIGQEFDVNESLLLLADTAMLPRTDGLASGGPVPEGVLKVLAIDSVVRGRCTATRAPAKPPTCPAALPGYLVRFSDVFQLPGDTARLYIRFERFQRTGATETLRPLAFENGYELVHQGGSWRVVRKARRESQIKER